MRKTVFTVILCFFAAIMSFAAAAETEDSMRRFGIFIGSNNGGRDRTKLRYAESDAKSVSKVFVEMGGILGGDAILLIEPSINDITRQFDSLREQVIHSKGLHKRTEFVFYYSGHSDEDGLLLNREKYSYRDLRDQINAIPSDMRIVVLDSCASGAFTRIKGGAKVQPFLLDGSLFAEGHAFLTSSSANEASQESDRIGGSYFTHSMVAGLRGAADSVGDGRVTLNELYRFAYSETLAMTETSMYGTQHPSYDIQVSGTGDLVLTDIKENSAIMAFDTEITGRLSIRDSMDHLIAEINKTTLKPLELGLEPGLYRITLQQGDTLLRAEVTLVEGKQALINGTQFQVIGAAPARLRGGDDEEQPSPAKENTYTVFYNYVHEPFKFPLIGFVNIFRGSFSGVQAGFFNLNTQNLNGVQVSFINTIGGSLNGVQVGYTNTVAGGTEGVQVGFVNTAVGDSTGAQGGFINTTAGERKGSQIGFVNTAAGNIKGAQIGFVNVATKKVKGMQLGFVNYADSVEGGVPIGFVSIVKNGGYRAVEYSLSEMHPVNVTFKLGIEKFYTNFTAAYNPIGEFGLEQFAWGLGFGSIIPIAGPFFINPEYNVMSSIKHEESADNGWTLHSRNMQSFALSLGFNLGKHFSVTAGPSLTWISETSYYHNKTVFGSTKTAMPEPWFKMYRYDINERNSLVVGARAAVRVRF